MAVSQVITGIRRTVSDLAEKSYVKRLKQYRDESRAHRIMIANTAAYKEMERRKDQALIDVRRYGFVR